MKIHSVKLKSQAEIGTHIVPGILVGAGIDQQPRTVRATIPRSTHQRLSRIRRIRTQSAITIARAHKARYNSFTCACANKYEKEAACPNSSIDRIRGQHQKGFETEIIYEIVKLSVHFAWKCRRDRDNFEFKSSTNQTEERIAKKKRENHTQRIVSRIRFETQRLSHEKDGSHCTPKG